MPAKNKLSNTELQQLLATLKSRFEKNMNRHKGLEWAKVEERITKQPDKAWSLQQMEVSGGEPDVVGYDKAEGTFLFFDCSAESPKERRSLCFDDEALEARKENKPQGSAIGMAHEMGVALLSEEEYRFLQELGKFDLKTSSWVQTPANIRKLGGALFCDRRYDTVFLYHNGVQSYYAARAFRASLKV
ncbi:DUF4256 domain-containing protein [Parasegetibacter sp. NRK P23]|uniref:DUF4256 domain-containing protein n=1 Tax=Parasegetibacter sp. NRK P23 TaxID=2942999 RepID=UPI002042CDF4|nr:DUF4256 domain-containing protein [Parasegetibacter sp. NRK P23]MCM5528609.1 DUF4256 domain-containing protein [Parasegetibacter sp. NRK P23]